MKMIITMAATLLIGLPAWGQGNFGSGISTVPNLDPTQSALPSPTINRDLNTTINTTGAETSGAEAGSQFDTGTNAGVNTGSGTGTGYSPVAPTSPWNTPASTNPMGGWQGGK